MQSQPAAFTFASHSPDEESDDDAGGPEKLQARPPLRRSSVGAATAAAPVAAPGAVAPASPPLARAHTSVAAADENAPANDVPFEDIALLLASRNARTSAAGEQVKPKLKVSASGKFEDQFYHAHEGSRAMGKLKNRTYLKQQDKKDSGKAKKNANVNGKDVEQFSDSDIVYSGYLVKQGSFWKTWRRRYFILRRDVPVLSYYDSAEELTKLGEITVDGKTSVRPTPREGFPFQFVVEHEARTLTLVAEQGKPSSDAWVTHIQQLIQRRAQAAENARLSVLRQSGERPSLGLRLSESAGGGSFLEERPSVRKSALGVHAAGRDSPHGAPMKRFATDAVAIAGAMQESIAAREEERLRDRHLRQSRATNLEETTPTWKAVHRDSVAPSPAVPPRRFRSFSAGSVLSTRSTQYEPMRPRDDFGLAPSGSRASMGHDGASASGYPVNEHPQTRAPCLSLPAFKPGPSLELAVSVGSKGAQEAPHMVVVMSTVAPGKEPREISRTEMQGSLALRACGSDFFARDFSAALSIPLSTKDVLHFEVFSFKNPGTEVLASQLSLGFVRISPVDIMLSRDSTIVLECHRARHATQLLFLMLDRFVPSETINLSHSYTYAKRHFISDIVPVEATPAVATPAAATPEKLTHSVPSSLGAASYGEMVRGSTESQEASHVFISEELSSSYCSISVALAYLEFAQARNKARMGDARTKISEFEHKFGPAPPSPTHKTQPEYDAFHDMEAQLARYSRLRDVYRTCEDYCGKLQAMLEDGKEPGVTGSLKRSVQKKDLYTEFMPTNLNVHLTRAKRVVLSSGNPTGLSSLTPADSTLSASAPAAGELVHAVITHGCTAAHVLGFKDGGLRRLLHASAQAPKDEKLLEKIEQRQDVVRSQVLAVASAAFLTVLGLAVNSKSPVHMDRLKLICSTGFLVSIESLLSTVRNEKGMIEDMVEGVKWLNASVSLQVTDTAAMAPSAGKHSRLRYAKCVDVSSAANGSDVVATFALPSEVFAGLPDLLKKGDPVKLHAVMFTQGINEMQSVANTMLDTRLQDEINYESVQMLDRYFRVFQSFVKYNARHHADSGSDYNAACLAELPQLGAEISTLVEKLNVAIKPHVQKKNVNILLETSDICRRLGAGRTTCCKSGKDRTAMSVTLESSQILVDLFHVKQGVHLCAAMRERGVRRVNVLANTGKDKYAFNSFQLKYIPECYKPPTATADSHVAS
ncbi:hypothetical protein PybrP1_011398 [[Pythium] brassicae (nom. inval.)]|nr:hypothetical protein PybrP1_011398 [[Pythium] brassicae (nom. inval.)]